MKKLLLSLILLFLCFGAWAQNCIAPANLNIVKDGNNQIISWTPSGVETEWEIEYKPYTDTSWANAISVINISSTSYTLLGSTSFIGIDFRVKAICSPTNQSEWSFCYYPLNGNNFDFSNNNYLGWRAYQAQNISTPSTISFSPWVDFTDPTTCLVYGTPCFELNGDTNEIDPIISTLKKIPSGYSHSTKINCNPTSGTPYSNANMLSYDILLNDSNCLLTLNYALVFQAPGHSGYQNPFFKIDIISLNSLDQEVGLINNCSAIEVLGYNSTVTNSFGTFMGGIWQDWKEVSLNLKEYVNQKVRVKIILAACQPSSHWGYGYFVGKAESPKIKINATNSSNSICELEAPSGFKKYEWFSNPSDLPESQLYTMTMTMTTPIFESTADSINAANNKCIITNSIYNTYGEYYFVRLSSLTNQTNSCQTYIKRVKNPLNINLVDTICQGDIYTNHGFNEDTTGIYSIQIPINSSNINYILDLTVNDTTAPTNLLTNNSAYSIQLTWEGNSSIYKIYRFDDLIGIVDNTSFIDTNVIEGNNYCYRVKSINGDCESDFSNSACQLFLDLNNIKKNSSEFILCPNPAKNHVKLFIRNIYKNINYEISDIQGNVLDKKELKPTNSIIKEEIELSSYSKGIYFIKLSNDNFIKTEKLIVQ